MTSEEQQRLMNLCRQIEVEQDPRQFLKLIEELNELLGGKAQRLTHTPPSPPVIQDVKRD